MFSIQATTKCSVTTMTKEINFTHLLQLQEQFYNGRPLMKRHNNNMAQVAQLLTQEVEELNGHTEDGIPLSKYRKQELSDIAWFALAMTYMLEYSPHPMAIARYVEPIAADYVWSEEHYEEVKQEMIDALKPIAWLLERKEVTREELTDEQRNIIAEVVAMVLGKAWTIFAMLGVRPEIEIAEKSARNNDKHEASLYLNPEGDYAASVREANRRWKGKLQPINHDPDSASYILNEVRAPGDPQYYQEGVLPGNPIFYETGAYVSKFYDPKEWRGKDHGKPLPLVPITESISQFLPEPATIATR